MSIGVNQLLNAASYFILAYYMTEVQGSKRSRAHCEAKVPSSATYGVVVPWKVVKRKIETDLNSYNNVI